MGRLVNTDDLYELIDKHFDGVRVYDVFSSDAVYDFHRIVDSTPTVDAEPVRHGHWVYYKNMGYFCSACIEHGLSPTNGDDNCGYSLDGTMKYCWNCGAKMDG